MRSIRCCKNHEYALPTYRPPIGKNGKPIIVDDEGMLSEKHIAPGL